MKHIKLLIITTLLVLLGGCKSTTSVSDKSVKVNQSRIDYLSIGEWNLGDKRELIQSLSTLPNLKPVSVTGGLETSEAIFNNEKKNISFAFEQNELVYSQVWMYEGNNIEEAAVEFANLYQYFEDNLGGGSLKGFDASGGFNASLIKNAVLELYRNVKTSVEKTNLDQEQKMAFTINLDLIPNIQPRKNKLHGSFIYSGVHDIFLVFLFEDLPNSGDRSSKSHVSLDAVES